jgi:hypothetical protein
MNINSNLILGVFIYKNDENIVNLIRAIQTFAPDLHKKIVYQDLTNKTFDNFPNIVKTHKALPILVLKGINEPLIGIISIQKWLSSQTSRSSDHNSSNRSKQGGGSLSNNERENFDLPNIFKKGDSGELDGFFPQEMKKSSSNYSYLEENIEMETNHEKLYGMSGNIQKMKESDEFSDTKSGKNSDTSKRFEEMMNERKKLIESQVTQGNFVKI